MTHCSTNLRRGRATTAQLAGLIAALVACGGTAERALKGAHFGDQIPVYVDLREKEVPIPHIRLNR